MYCNAKIYDVNHLADTLIKLECGSMFSKMKQEGISRLQHIKFLDFRRNRYIHNVNHLKDIEELYCGYEINDDRISELRKLEELDCRNNDRINDANHLTRTLEKNYCSPQIIS